MAGEALRRDVNRIKNPASYVPRICLPKFNASSRSASSGRPNATGACALGKRVLTDKQPGANELEIMHRSELLELGKDFTVADVAVHGYDGQRPPPAV